VFDNVEGVSVDVGILGEGNGGCVVGGFEEEVVDVEVVQLGMAVLALVTILMVHFVLSQLSWYMIIRLKRKKNTDIIDLVLQTLKTMVVNFIGDCLAVNKINLLQ
jgi:hypothetical protein